MKKLPIASYSGSQCLLSSTVSPPTNLCTLGCQNNGVCQIATDGTQSCICPSNIYGSTCQFVLSVSSCQTGDTDTVNCPLWNSLGLCTYTYTYNSGRKNFS